MRVRRRFLLVMALSVMSLVSTVAVVVWTVSETRAMNNTTREGMELIADARQVHMLMKDMLVGVFTPRTYGVLKDLVHLELLSATRRSWESSASQFFERYETFLRSPTLTRLVDSDPQLDDEHAVALRLLDRTQVMTLSLRARLRELEAQGILGREDTYNLIQRAADPEVLPVFDEIRETSFYLTNTFESFLHHFVSSVEERVRELQQALLMGMGVFVAFVSLVTVAGTWVLSRSIVRNVAAVAQAMEALSRGNFDVRPAIHSDDEFGELSDNFAGFLRDLRGNVNVVLDLQHNLQKLAGRERPVQEVFPLVCETVRLGVHADSVMIQESEPYRVVAWSGEGHSFEDESRSLRILMNPERGRSLVLHRADRVFTELEVTILNSYAEFAELVVQNHVRYAELLERRNAQYEALQAQIRPHFLYNVLNNLMGLNRMADRDGMENSIIALKDLLRYSLGQERFSTLGAEIEVAGRYCTLQQLRFGDRISFDLQCPPELRDISMPKLILQPLVENAIIHGLEPKDRPGHLWVYVQHAAEEAVDVVVEDDGVGFPEKRAQNAEHSRIGLANVEKRLQVAYTDARLIIVPRAEGGTRCTLRIPTTANKAACAS